LKNETQSQSRGVRDKSSIGFSLNRFKKKKKKNETQSQLISLPITPREMTVIVLSLQQTRDLFL
jgi:hypothetical protein